MTDEQEWTTARSEDDQRRAGNKRRAAELVSESCPSEPRPLKWQPISTAPRDGTKIIVHVPSKVIPAKKGKTRRTRPVTLMARWFSESDELMGAHRGELLEKHKGYWSAHFKGSQPLPACPSHWMPVPPDPLERLIDVED